MRPKSRAPRRLRFSGAWRLLHGAALLGLLLVPVTAVPESLLAQERQDAGGAGDAAAGEEGLATLRGRVVSAMTGGPLPDARVVLAVAGRGAFTDSAGRFTITDVPAGLDTVRVGLVGFAEQQAPLTLAPGRVTRATFMLSESVLRLEEITVEVESDERTRGKLSGFWERRSAGTGYYITPEMIEEREGAQVPSDLLRTVPGVRVGNPGFGGAPIRIGRATGTSCRDPTYWVDGVRNRTMTFDDLNVDELAAIEIYRGPSETPARFAAGAGCGVIVVWTAEGGRR